MKTRKFIALMIVSIFLASYTAPFFVEGAKAAESVNLSVEDVFWGTPPNNVQSVSPGDVNVPLTVIIHNNSNNTLRGVIGILDLTYPFLDYKTESYQSKAEGQPLQAGNVFNQTGDVLPSGSFSLTFYLNIHPDATKGRYTLNLTVYYNVKINDTTFVSGIPWKEQISVVINNQPPNIYSINPTTNPVNLFVGESANFTVKANDPDGDPITIEWLLDDETIGFGSNITIKANSSDVGSHVLEARVSDGNLTTSNIWTININRRIDTNISVSTQYLFAGRKNRIEVNASNNAWFGTVTFNLGVPQQMVLMNDSTLEFENVTENESIGFNIVLFVPEVLIGQTGALTITVNYKDVNGNSYTETYTFGMVVRGVIDIKVYGVGVDPNPAVIGSKVSITGSLLNTGNVLAKYVNITLLNNSVIVPDFTPYIYIGDLDANSPTPFTLTGVVSNGVQKGTYKLAFLLEYTDDLYEEHSLIFYVTLTVVEPQGEEGSSSSGGNQVPLMDMATIAIGLIAVLSIAVVYIRRRGG